MMYDVIIIGGGPAGAAAAVYAARKRLKTLLITEVFGGQSVVSDDIQNWIGESHISGFDLAKKIEGHVRLFSDVVEIKMPERVVSVRSAKCTEPGFDCEFQVATASGAVYEGKSVILACGARRKKLEVPGEKQFDGKGVAYCATCDAPLFDSMNVAVIGSGNAALESVVDLSAYASKIYMVIRGDRLKGDAVTQEEVKKNPKVTIFYNAVTKEIIGEKMVTRLVYIDTKTNEEKALDVRGVFVEIGSMPNSDIVKGLVDLDQFGQVIVDAKYASTSHLGVFAAGDITDDPYKQNNISAGDGVKAALSAYAYLLKREKKTPADA